MAITHTQPKIWLAETLRRYEEDTVWRDNNIVTILQNPQGNSIEVPAVTAVTPKTKGNYNHRTRAGTDEPGSSTATLNINQTYVTYADIDDQVIRQSNSDVFESIAYAQGQAMADIVDQYIANTVSKDTGIPTTNKLAGTGGAGILLHPDITDTVNSNGKRFLNDLAWARQKMNEANVPKTGRWCIIPPQVETLGVLNDSRLFGNSGIMSDRLVQEGAAQFMTPTTRVLGFDIFVSNNYVDDSGSGTKGIKDLVVCGHRTAIYFAEQRPAAGVEVVRDATYAGDHWRAPIYFGAKVVRPNSLAVITYNTTTVTS